MEVKDIMTNSIISVGQNEPVMAAARLLKRYNIGALPVHDDRGTLRGVVTDRDIVLRCVALENDPAETRVREIMSRNLCTVSPGDSVADAAEKMSQSQIRRMPVVEAGKLVGILSLGDLARQESARADAACALSDISENIRRCAQVHRQAHALDSV